MDMDKTPAPRALSFGGGRRALAACLVAAALLAGCAGGAGPGGTRDAKGGSVPRPWPTADCVGARGGESPSSAGRTGDLATTPHGDAGLDMTFIGDSLRESETETPAQAGARLQALAAPGSARTAARRLEWALLLLNRSAPTPEQLTQAQDLLKGLDHAAGDAGARQLVRMLQRTARERAELAQLRAVHAADARELAALQDKLQQIRNLEVELQQRGTHGGSR